MNAATGAEAAASPAPAPEEGWNVVVTLSEPTFRQARKLLARWGDLRRTEFHYVLVMTVSDPAAFLAEFGAAVQEAPGILNDVSHVIPFERTFTFDDTVEFEQKARDIVLGWTSRLSGRSFHVRLHRRGLKEMISTPAEERLLDDALLEALAATGAPGGIAFDDPDCVVLIETVGQRAGVALWTREDMTRYPFLGVD
jgi:tRNA(Ser,Leu) C12 N-acetylase TAN1